MVGGPDTVERIVESTGGFGADYTFEATGNVNVMRQAVESARMGWGLCTVAGVAGKGETLDIVPRYPDHRPPRRRLVVRRRQGPRRRPAARRALARRRHRRRVVHLASHHARRGEPRLRADGSAGRHPERDPVLMILERAEHPKWTSNAYLVADGDGGHGVLVDSNGVEAPLLAAGRRSATSRSRTCSSPTSTATMSSTSPGSRSASASRSSGAS